MGRLGPGRSWKPNTEYQRELCQVNIEFVFVSVLQFAAHIIIVSPVHILQFSQIMTSVDFVFPNVPSNIPETEFSLPSAWTEECKTGVKRKRGRPRKSKVTDGQVKRKRGRPRKRPKVATNDKVNRKRGRPRKKRKLAVIKNQRACQNNVHCDRCAGASASPLLLEQTHPCCAAQPACITRDAAFTAIMNGARLNAANNSRRYEAYRGTDRWRNGIGQTGVRRPLPRCVLVYVRRTWPSTAYTGYRP
jgi:hypothetical protein